MEQLKNHIEFMQSPFIPLDDDKYYTHLNTEHMEMVSRVSFASSLLFGSYMNKPERCTGWEPHDSF